MDGEDDRGSSPDPLTASWNNTYAIRPSVSPRKRSANPTPQKPKRARRSRAGNGANSSEIPPQTLIFTTPTKEVGTKGRIDSSPWKIKVTVQAEQEDASNTKDGSPREKTSKVPLRGGDERGTVKRKSSKAGLSGADSSSNVTTPESVTEKKRNGSSSRKRKQSSSNVVKTGTTERMPGEVSDLITLNTPHSTRNTPCKRRKGGIGSKPSSKPQVRKITDALHVTPLHEKPENAHLAWGQFQVDCTPFGQRGEPSAKRKIRQRVPTPRKPIGFDENDLSSLPDSTPVASQSHDESDDPQQRLLFDATLGPTGNDDPEKELELESDDEDIMGVEPLEDDTRVLDQSLAESEGFTMVSIHSLKSRTQAESENETHRPSVIVETTANEVQENDENVQRVSVDMQTHESKNFQNVNTASETLEEPQAQQQIDLETPRTCNPFGGFGNATRRALSAGLAMGELLARSQPGFAYHNTAINDCNNVRSNDNKDSARDQGHGRLPTPPETASSPGASFRQTSEDERTPVQSIEESASYNRDDACSNHLIVKTEDSMMSWRPSTPTKVIPQPPELTQSQEFERQWQIERDEVIRQAENLNSSQVIYIESGSTTFAPFSCEDAEQEDAEMGEATDIWQEEADRSLEDSSNVEDLRTISDAERGPEEQTPDLRELLGEDIRPLRSKLPRTWRRTSGNHFLYSDEAESPARPSQVIDKPQANDSKFTKESNYRNEQSVQSGRQSIALRTILSSPEKRSLGLDNTPKEVRFKNSTTEYANGDAEFADSHYFSSELSIDNVATATGQSNDEAQNDKPAYACSSTNGDEHCPVTRYKVKESDEAQIMGLSQLQKDLKTLATPKGRVLMNDPDSYTEEAPQGKRSMLAFNPRSSKPYSNLFGDRSLQNPLDKPMAQKKADPNREKHIKWSQTINIETAPMFESSRSKGIFGRLASWLYPPMPPPEPQYAYTFDWDRNHYLVLNHHWERYFQSPNFVEPLPLARLPTEKPLIPYLERLIAARITRFDGVEPLIVTKIHCQIATSFIAELRDRGLPLLCDGRRKVPRHIRRQSPNYDPTQDTSEDEDESMNEWPKRDADGRVVRCKQDWTPEETLKGVYGLWLIKMKDAEQVKLLEKKARKAARKERRESQETSFQNA